MPVHRPAVRIVLIVLAALLAFSTVVGWVTLWLLPELYTPILAGTLVDGQTVLAGALLGVVVGGFQWAALHVTWRRPRRFPLAHLAAGMVMVVWIFLSSLILGTFTWMHALWGGAGVAQVTLVAVYLGALSPVPPYTRNHAGAGTPV